MTNSGSPSSPRPILLPDDPTYRGAQIPLRFYEVAAWLDDQRLAASGYVLDQTALAQRILSEPDRRPRTAPPLGAFKTFLVPIADIARMTEIGMSTLVDADVLRRAGVVSYAQPSADKWIKLHTYDEAVFR